MLIVQETFVCKPGMASKAAKMFKESTTSDSHVKYILTDFTGQFHRVVVISEYKDLADYDKAWEEYKNPTPEMKEAMSKMQNFNDMYVSGSREIYQTW